MSRRFFPLLVALVLTLACGSTRPRAAEEKYPAEQKLRRETEAALAALRPVADQAAARWRAELLGRVRTRDGQPVPEAALFTEVRRAAQAAGEVAPAIEALWQDLLRDRIDQRGFGDQLDEIFSQAIITSWDVQLAEARHRLALAQARLDAANTPLRAQWQKTFADLSAREGLTTEQRLKLIADAAEPVRAQEQRLLGEAVAQLDATARQITRARQALLDLVKPRAEDARQAQRPGAPQRLTDLVAAQFESDPVGTAGGSSLDELLVSARLNFAASVLRGELPNLALASRIPLFLATRLAATSTALFQGPRPPPPPRISYVTVLERGTDPATGATTRVLGILGLNLLDAGTPTVSGEPDRVYEVIATRGGVLGVKDGEPQAAAWQTLGNRAGAGLLRSEATMAKLLDAVLVRVRLPAGLLPGLESIRVAGAAKFWPLDAPTTRASLAFIRQMPWALAHDFDRPPELFLHSEFAVQVETQHPMRADFLEIALIGPDGELTLEDATGQRVTRLRATRLDPFPLQVRTAPIHLFPVGLAVPFEKRAPGHFYLWLQHNDTVVATIVGRPFDDGNAATTVDAATVLATPGNVHTVEGKGMLFFEALADAARLHQIELADLDLSSPVVVDQITHTFIAQLRQAEIRFTLFDHAAMLALKRTFIAMAERVLANHRAVLASPARVRAYIPEMTRIMFAGARLTSDTGTTKNFPLGYAREIRIVSEKGLTAMGRDWFRGRAMVPLFYAFHDDPPFAIYDDPDEAKIFRHAATRIALESQVENLEKSIAYARACDDDDVEELVELVGHGFEAVIAEVMPRLLRSEPDLTTGRTRWVPDRMARLAVRQLADTLQEHLTAKKAAKADTDAVLALLSATGLGLAEGTAAKVVLAVASAASVGAAGLDIVNLELSRAESKFAANAVEIIGEDRLVHDTSTIDLTATPYLTFALSVVGLKFDFADMSRAIQLSAARRTLGPAMARITESGFPALARLAAKEQAFASALMDEATTLRAAGKRLTAEQEMAARAADRIETQFAGYHPWRGGPFPPKPSLHPPADDPMLVGTAIENDLHVAVTEVEPRTNPSITAAPESPRPVSTPDVTPRPVEAPAPPRRYMDVKKIPKDMPMPGDELADLVAPAYRVGHMAENYRLGGAFGAGAYATTYELLDAAGRPTGRVVKFLRTPWQKTGVWMKRFEDIEDDLRKLKTHGPWDGTPLPEVIDRMLESQKLLENAKIPHLKIAPLEEGIAKAGREAEVPFLVQDIIPEKAVLIGHEEALNRGQQAAVARLYKRLSDANLVWVDGHVENLYFKLLDNGSWEAGILDPDMIVRFDQAITSEFYMAHLHEIFELPTNSKINAMRIRDIGELPTPDILRRVAGSAHEFMARMLEFRGYVEFGRLPGERFGTALRYLDAKVAYKVVVEEFGDLARYIKN